MFRQIACRLKSHPGVYRTVVAWSSQYFTPDRIKFAGQVVNLSDAESHHVCRVLRQRDSSVVQVMDGFGGKGRGTLAIRGKMAQIELTDAWQDAPPSIQVTVASAVPKGDLAELVVEKCSELGAMTLQWMRCERSVTDIRAQKYEKWRRHALEAAKQSERAWLMNILPEQPMRDVAMANLSEADRSLLLWCDHRAGSSPIWQALSSYRTNADSRRNHANHSVNETTAGSSRSSNDAAHVNSEHSKPQRVTVLVGPEGGWSDAETQLLTSLMQAHPQRALRVCLSPHVLRMETAALAATAAVIAWGQTL